MRVRVRNLGLLPKNLRSFPQSSRGESSRFDTPSTPMQRLSPVTTVPRLASRSAQCGRGLSVRTCISRHHRPAGVVVSPLSKGEEYIVYAHDSAYGDDSYTVGICSRTALLGQAQDDIDALGEGQAPQAGTGGSAPEEPEDTAVDRARDVILAVAAPILALVGFVVNALMGCR